LQFNTAGGSEFQVRGMAVLNDPLANDVRRNGTHSSGMDDDRVLRVLVRNEMCWPMNTSLKYLFHAQSDLQVKLSTFGCRAFTYSGHQFGTVMHITQ